MSSPKTIARLARRAQQGDRKAFAELYRLHFGQVYYIAHKMLRNEQEATEVAQDTFEVAYTKIATLKNPTTFQRWVNIIAHNLCVNILRTRDKDKQRFAEVVMNEQDLPISENNREFLPEEYLHSKEDRATVAKLVETLPTAQRETILMYYYEDLSAAEIAEVTGAKESTIHRRLFDARETLKRRLGEPDRPNKAVVMGATAVPVLTQVLKGEALAQTSTPAFKAAFTGGWNHLASTFSSLSSSSVSAPVVSTATMGKVGGVAISKSLVAAVAAVAITGAGIVAYSATRPVSDPPVIEEGAELSPAPAVDMPKSIETSATEEVEASPASAPSSTAKKSKTTVQKTVVEKPVVPAAPVRPTIELDQTELMYRKGTVVPLKTIITDSGAVAHDENGKKLAITAQLYDFIDFDTEGEYVLSLTATDTKGVAALTQVITVLIR